MSNEKLFEEDINLSSYEIKNSNETIYKNQGISPNEKNNEDILKLIEELHINLNIHSSELINKIKDCFNDKKISLGNIKRIIDLVKDKSIPNEIINNLEKFYDFLYDQSQSLKKENIKIIFNDEFFNKYGNFDNILREMKFAVFKKQFNLEEESTFDKILRSCIELNLDIVSIKEFFDNILSKLKLEDEESIKKEIEHIQSEDLKILKENELKKVMIKNEKKLLVLRTLFDIISAYPKLDIKSLEKIDFNKELYTAVRDFYIECSKNSIKDEVEPLSSEELLNSLQNLNRNYFSDGRIYEFRNQIKICNSMKNNVKSTDIKKWIKDKFKNFDFTDNNKKNEYIAQTLGVISIALFTAIGKNENEKFYLRDSQILAILIFIDNHGKSKGIIEEISTGEGKSAIISCLASYFGLRGYKVDIITSSKTLAERDANKFQKFYNLLGLEDDYCRQYEEAPYRADIVYGTFLDFEGDLLDEISSNKKIRGDRKYEIIIIDEVDNMFIDGIEGSTQLTHSSKGYQYLIPLYLSIYLFVDILDHLLYEQIIKQYYEIINNDNYKNLSDESKNKILQKINDVSERKNTFIEYIEKCFKDIMKELEKKNPEYAKLRSKDYEKDLIKINNIIKTENINEDELKLKNSLNYPEFLNDFVQSQFHYWINNAYQAKNIFKKEKDYTISSKRLGYDCITPIDRKNTGELELNTVYRNGLHQMLQIKENIRVQSETLTHTFLSHVTYFQKFQKGNFFGLTGTIGGEETHEIYNNQYFNSNLVFIPQYKKKRFIELPPKLCINDYETHLNLICKEIIYHYSRGRKILVICKDIDEGENIKRRLKDGKFDLKNIYNEIDENYKNDIFLYLRNDKDNVEKELKESKNRIIISTNLGGRGTDIDTNEDIENKGGLHVIITKLSSNSRTQKQAFGRTSRQGKKGSGQFIIIANKNNLTYNELIINRDEKEKERISKIDLNFLILKDDLFIKYIEFIKQYNELKDDESYFLKADIDERWSFFLKKYVNENIKLTEKVEKEIYQKFNDFIQEIKNIMKLPRYKRFNNNFLRISEGVRIKHRKNDKGLNNYLNFKGNEECFYFAVFYYKAIIEHSYYLDCPKDPHKDKDYCEEIIKYFNITKEKLYSLIEVNINPILKSFKDWEELSQLEKYFKVDKTEKSYQEKNFFKQFLFRQNLITKLIGHIDRNIGVINDFIQIYSKKNIKKYKYYLSRENVLMEDELKLDAEEIRNLDYFNDAGFYDLFKFRITKPVKRRTGKFWLIFLGYFLLISISSIALSFIPIPIVPNVILFIENLVVKKFITKSLSKEIYLDYVDIHENNSIFSIIKRKITSIFSSNQNGNGHNENKNINSQMGENNNNAILDDGLKREEIEEMKNILMEYSKANIKEIIALKINNIREEIKFLLLVDKYNKNRIWNDKIMNIIIKNFNKKVYEEKYKIIQLLNKKSKYKEGIKIVNSLIEEIIINAIKEIKENYIRKEYNEKEGLTCLEHIIINSSYGKMNENTSSEIVNQILSNNIIDKNYNFNKVLFKKTKLNQNTRIFFKINYPSNTKKIKSINDFQFNKTFDIPIESDPILKDLQLLYMQNGYNNADSLLFIDYNNKIKNLLYNIFILSCEENNNKEFENFVHNIKNKLIELVEIYLKGEIYPNILININRQKSKKLNREEEEVFNRIIEISGKEAFKSIKSENYQRIIFN